MRRRNKLLFLLGLLLIISAVLLFLYFIYNKFIDRQQTNLIIKEIFDNEINISQTEIITESVETISTEDHIVKGKHVEQDGYLGYIEISSVGIKRLITLGTATSTLNKGSVGMLTISASLDEKFGNVILAGHSISNVFQNLHYITIGDSIKIVSHSAIYYYKVVGKYTIEENDLSYFKKVSDKKILTLVTCKNNNKQRLIVLAELCK